jgi:GNAT superfamily N-acetyltransferase
MALPDTPPVRTVATSEVDAIARVLANAFASDPVMSYLIGNRGEDQTERRLTHLFASAVRIEAAKPASLAEVAGTGEAAAVWHEIDEWRAGPRDQLRSLIPAIRTFGKHLPRAAWIFTAIEAAHPTEPHRHLAFIGVHRDHQGKGLGSALLASMTERLDTEGIAAYLESSNPRNEPLYARHGFVASPAIDLPPGTPPLIPMWRDPR